MDVTPIRECAKDCELVDLLLGEVARARGVPIEVSRITHGMPPEGPATRREVSEMGEDDQRQEPRRRGPLRCDACGGVINPATSECRCSD